MIKILLLGSGELGKFFTLAAQKYGCEVIAVDKYPNAPAMQVTNRSVVIDMMDTNVLLDTIRSVNPDFIVPEVEAISIEALHVAEGLGYKIVPSYSAVHYTMNRANIRGLAEQNNIPTSKSFYANSPSELVIKLSESNFTKCVVKPAMSSSGKGQSIIHNESEALIAWDYAIENARGNINQVIVEEFVDFEYEVTLLSFVDRGYVRFCDPILHHQVNGDFVWSSHNQQDFVWDHPLVDTMRDYSRTMIAALNPNVNNGGLYGVEFFVKYDPMTNTRTALFSEMSPRPHDTGMVTLESQDVSEFDIHIRSILGLHIPLIFNRGGFCKTINYDGHHNASISDEDFRSVCESNSELLWFNKEPTKIGRRMGVILSNNHNGVKRAVQSTKLKI